MKKKKRIGLITVWTAITVLLLPFLYTMTYCLPSPDDFWKSLGYTGNGLFMDSVRQANDFYMNWFGGWIWEFMELFFNPLILFGSTSRMYGVEMIVFFCLFILSVFGLIKTFNRFVVKQNSMLLCSVELFLILFVFLNSQYWTEILYWFCGANYMWAMTFMFWSIALIIRNYCDEYRGYRSVLISILGFIACTSYTETIFPGMIYVFFIWKDWKKNKRLSVKKAYPLLFMIAGGLSCVLAPGNMARYGSTVDASLDGLSVKNALLYTVKGLGQSVLDVWENPCVFLAMLVFLVIGMYYFRDTAHTFRFGNWCILMVMALICLYVTYFPFVLGYSSNTYFPNRMQFVFYMYAILLAILECLYLGGLLAKLAKKKQVEIFTAKFWAQIVTVFVLTVYTTLIVNGAIHDTIYVQTIYKSGQVRQAFRNWNYMLETLETTDEEDVVLEWHVFETPIINYPGISEDPEHDINQKIAKFYNKKSVRMKWLL